MPQYSQGPVPEESFADGIDRITVNGGVVRIDFFSFETPPQDGRTDREPERTVRRRVILPMDGFLRSLAAMSDIVKKLEESGLVTRNPPPAPGTSTTIAPAAAPAGGAAPAKPAAGAKAKPGASSPNFG